MIEKHQNKRKKITLSDVALEAGVGQATVDRFLNGRSNVKPKTAEKILAAVELLDYRPLHMADNIKNELTEKFSKCPSVGFIFPSVKDSVYEFLLKGLSNFISENYKNPVEPIVRECNIQDFSAVAREIEHLSHQVEYIGIVVLDDPLVGLAVKHAIEHGVKVFTLFSPISDSGQIVHIGTDDRKVGRTAAWLIHKLAHEVKNIALFQGNNRFLCQEACEISFISYFRERNIFVKFIGPVQTQEDDLYAEKQTDIVIQGVQGVNVIYAPCGGVKGIINSITNHKVHDSVFLVCHGPFGGWEKSLIEGSADVVIHHDMAEIVNAIATLLSGKMNPQKSPLFIPISFEMKIRENI